MVRTRTETLFFSFFSKIFLPSLTACLASSPGRINRVDVWMSREEIAFLCKSQKEKRKFFLPSVDRGEISAFFSNSSEDILHKIIHDTHSLLTDSRVWMNLFEDFVDVGRVEGAIATTSWSPLTFDGLFQRYSWHRVLRRF